MTALLSQFGVVDESTYGTPVTVTRFYETDGIPDFQPDQGRAEAGSLRSGARVQSSLDFVPFRRGAKLSVAMPVPTKNWGWWLKHLLGTTATGTVSDSNYTHTGTVGTLLGDFFTSQIGVPLVGSATVQPFTLHGCKVESWELSCDVDNLLRFSAEIDAEDYDDSTSLASVSYPSGALVFAFVGATVSIASSTVNVKNVSITGDTNLDTDRRFLKGSALKLEPLENGFREYGFSCEAEFTSLTQLNRFTDADRADTLAEFKATFDGPVAHGGTTLPRLEVTIPAARFDMVDLSTGDNGESIMQTISGVARYDLSNSPITITYRTTDSTA